MTEGYTLVFLALAWPLFRLAALFFREDHFHAAIILMLMSLFIVLIAGR